MVQSLNLGGAQNGQAQSGIKRINRLPIVVIIALALAFLGVIFYGLASRGLYFGKDSGPETSSGNPASTYADQIKRGVTDGIIGEPQQQITYQPTPVETKQTEEKTNNPFTPQPAQRELQQRGQNLEAEAVWRARLLREQQEQLLREQQRQRMARLQANNAAYDAPLAIDRSKLEARTETNDASADTATRGPTVPTNTGSSPDLYAAALRAGLGGQNVDPNAQGAKEDFFNADLKELGYLPNRVVPPQSPFELKRGSVIPATLITGINSDLPGRITAQVSQSIYDSATGHRLLIPQGTKLFGRYDSKVSFGQKRVLVVWTDIIFPNGSTLQIGGMSGTDAQGYGGFSDKVNNHYLKTFGSAVLIALIGTGIDMAVPESSTLATQDTASDATRRNFAETFGRVADRTIQRNMDVQPTLEIRPGYKFNVLVDQDIVFPSTYRG
ncbi:MULTISPECIES: IncP-type conjugal transfer protein TrbI [Rhizobium/Agrobacterium group]|uniref:IncP-type conjugal transfer protein TrbI n=1 Tax=Rhizobium/Agrobacterium group TaxID=227290 RepID=UPI001571964E|nr:MULTISPECIES: IncP-type conjugal transfer protein TrbI [Rhizobium/Agrobacterium group]NTD86775.1 IncP-type conjugal transfer protein TrbI [Agrobacterium tumefaciens]NTD91502.1 IncP-type conjugal transfer protein TrbI [Agrobacterium tumefaciens]NTD96973.1 IncP-type conjugal transfer protein TrbI [Agrobacterium tumefaciens]NTE11874.1 IncP-type conjugal transfer protein TrbI [Agrobacterium tumefaciens]NTE24772.1 IncP-type conjugal transfer protein TrbI [Agrobacterium tumefaciens]